MVVEDWNWSNDFELKTLHSFSAWSTFPSGTPIDSSFNTFDTSRECGINLQGVELRFKELGIGFLTLLERFYVLVMMIMISCFRREMVMERI